jgi:hypothetical protein
MSQEEKPGSKTVRTDLLGPFLLNPERTDAGEYRDDDEGEDYQE